MTLSEHIKQKRKKNGLSQVELAFLLHFTRFFVTLQEFSAFLCIKAVWGIEEKLGYELETVLISAFCYKLHQRTPDAEPPAVLWLIIGCKGNHFCRKSQIYSHLFHLSLLIAHFIYCSIFCGTCQKSATSYYPMTVWFQDFFYPKLSHSPESSPLQRILLSRKTSIAFLT